jgi:hypothetical protein
VLLLDSVQPGLEKIPTLRPAPAICAIMESLRLAEVVPKW